MYKTYKNLLDFIIFALYYVCKKFNLRIMKKIQAIFRPEFLEPLKEKLRSKNVEVYKFIVSNVLGAGEEYGEVTTYRGVTSENIFAKKMQMQIFVNDKFVDKTIETIISVCSTNKVGDGKIFILPVEECIRIRDGKKGAKAIG